MLTNDEAKYLLRLEKLLIDSSQIIDLKNPKNRLKLFSPENSNYNFWLEITSNAKIILKTSLHHLESNTFIGLLRVDFRGRHKNPSKIIDTLPDELKEYAGKWFDIDEPHMHIYVEGYKPLVWAIPLKNTNLKESRIDELADLTNLILNFAKEINLKSTPKIQQALL